MNGHGSQRKSVGHRKQKKGATASKTLVVGAAKVLRKQDVLKMLQKVSHVKRRNIRLETRLSDLNLDSLDKVELLFKLEGLFDVEISDEHARAMTTVGDVMAWVEAQDSQERI